VMNVIGTLMGISLNMWIAFGGVAIFTILVLPIHEPCSYVRQTKVTFFFHF
jgi:hypothetical protein